MASKDKKGINQYMGYAVTTLLLSLFNKRSKSSSENTSSPSDLNVQGSATTLGSPIPVVLGRALLKAPLVSYYGDFRSEAYTETYAAHSKFDAKALVFGLIATVIASAFTGIFYPTGVTTTGGSGVTQSGKTKDITTPLLINSLFMFLLNWLINGRNLKTTVQKGFKYYLGYQYMICWTGENLTIKNIYLKEQNVFSGNLKKQDHLNGYTLSVNNENLFGGVDEDGGFVGDLRLYFGTDSQPLDSWMIQQMSQSSIQEDLRGLTPRYAPFFTIVVPTAYIGKSSSIPELWAEIQVIPNNLGLGAIGEDANPAEVIVEAHINKDWGLNESIDLLDTESLIEFGTKLKDEGMGISMLINNMTSAGDLIDNILDTVGGIKYSNPVTGKLSFKLIRDDYDINDLPVLDISNCKSCEFSRLDWSETVSSIEATYTDAKAFYEKGTVPVHDIANMAITNTITSKTYDFTFFTTPENALAGAMREGKSQGYPLSSVNIEANRTLAYLRAGDVFVLNWKPYGLNRVVYRVLDIDTGDLESGNVSISAIEDIYGLPKSVFDYSTGGEWKPIIKYPTGVNIFNYLEMPYELTSSRATYLYAMAVRPSLDTVYWSVFRDINGTFTRTSTMSNWTSVGELAYGYDVGEAIDTVGFELRDLYGVEDVLKNNATGTMNNRSGDNLILIDNEILSFNNIQLLPNGNYRLTGIIRGVYDTLPQVHNLQATVYFLKTNTMANVAVNTFVIPQGQTTTENLNIVTASVDNEEDFDYNKVRGFITKDRANRPSICADLRYQADRGDDSLALGRDAVISGNLLVDFKQRDKFQAVGIIAQTDINNYFTGLPIKHADSTKYRLKLTCDKGIFQKDYEEEVIPYDEETGEINKPIYPIVYVDYSEFDYLDIKQDTDFNFQLSTVLDGIESYSKYNLNFVWAMPTLVAVVEDIESEESLTLLSERGNNFTFNTPNNSYCTQFVVENIKAPLILQGVPCTEFDTGAVLTDKGWYMPTGKAYYYVGIDKIYEFDLKTGFRFKSWFDKDSLGRLFVYRWDNGIVEEVA